MTLAANIDTSGITNTGGGKFAVLSFSDNQQEIYELSFGDTLSMPKCSCIDWSRTGYPCKHFFAIFNKYPAWSWNDLSRLYTESPFLNLDLEVIPIANFDIDDKDRRKNEPIVNTNSYEKNCDNNRDFEFIDLPRKRKWRVNKATLLREALKEIKDASFLVDDEEVLDEALERLNELKLLFKKLIPTESNIPLEQQEVRYHEHEPKPKRPRDLTLRRKKDKFSGRHGETAERFKAARTIETASSRDVPDEKVQEMGEMLDLQEESVNISDAENENENKTIDQYLVKPLPNDEVELIKNNQMLTDVSINMAQKILSRQFKRRQCFQDTVLGQRLMFQAKEQFVQILHNNNFHWVTVSNLNSKHGAIDYYDSLFHGRIRDHVKLQICNIYKSENSLLQINIRSCQQQTNGVDCGIYAVANAFYILSGTDVSNIKIDENRMRAHFLQCLELGRFEPFPEKQTNTVTLFSPEKITTIELFCICKMPWVWYHSKNPDLNMAECDTCHTWYHRKCENIPRDVFNKFKGSVEWHCSNCKKVHTD